MPEASQHTKIDHFIPFSPPLIGEEEKSEMLDTLESGWITTGPKTEAFEAAMCEYVGVGHAVAVNSCTAALHLSLVAAGIESGDEVIMSPYTFASTGHVALYLGAKPVFVDVEPDTYNIDPGKIEAKITSRTKAIVPVHYGGHPCDMEFIEQIGKERNLVIIEDAAHAIGAEYNGVRVGGSGNLTCFSFYATKNLTTGEGGMVVCDDEEVAGRMRILSMYGISDARKIWKRYAPKGSWYYDIVELGFKCNMMDIQAALGLPQLRKLDEFNARRMHLAGIYDGILGANPAIQRPTVRSNVVSAWHLYPILVPEDVERDATIEDLKERNIGTSVLFQPLHLHSYYARELGVQEGDFPVAEEVYRRVICLPVSPRATDDEIHYVAETVLDLTE